MRLEAHSTVRNDFSLQIGSVSETVNVSAPAAMLQTDRADLGTEIETQTLETLALTFNRNHHGLIGLVPVRPALPPALLVLQLAEQSLHQRERAVSPGEQLHD
ncbi:MAG: hypothetical protein JWN34_6183 [Bryobacterales bacterium]|nr:hypothetical protein [Bryobacterales bacterium]